MPQDPLNRLKSPTLQQPLSPVQTLSYIPGLSLGRGFDSLNCAFRTADLLASTEAKTLDAKGTRYTYNIHSVEDSTQLKKTLQLGLSASYGLASGSLEYANSFELDTSSICFVAKMTIEFADETLKSTKGAPDILRQLTNMRVSDVYQQLGDQFVDSITYGGNIFVILNIQASDESDKERLSIQLRGAYGAFSAQGKFESSIEKIASHRETTVTVIGEGGEVKIASSVKDAKDAIQALASLKRDQAYPIRFQVTPMTPILAGSGLSANEVPRLGKNFAWLQDASALYDDLVKRKTTWKRFLAKRIDDEKAPQAIDQIDQVLAQLIKDVSVVRQTIVWTGESPKVQTYLPEHETLTAFPKMTAIGLPRLTVTATLQSGATTRKISIADGGWITCDTPAFGYCHEFITRINLTIDGEKKELTYQAWQRRDSTAVMPTEWVPAETDLGLDNPTGAETGNRLEGIAIKLSGVRGDIYEIAYQTQNFGYNPSAVVNDGALCPKGGPLSTGLIAVRAEVRKATPTDG